MLVSLLIVCATVVSLYVIARVLLWGAERAVENTHAVLSIGYAAIAAAVMRLLYGWLPVILSAPACGAVAYVTYNKIYPDAENTTIVAPNVVAPKECPKGKGAWRCYRGQFAGNKKVCAGTHGTWKNFDGPETNGLKVDVDWTGIQGGGASVFVTFSLPTWPAPNKSTQGLIKFDIRGTLGVSKLRGPLGISAKPPAAVQLKESVARDDNAGDSWLPVVVRNNGNNKYNATITSAVLDRMGLQTNLTLTLDGKTLRSDEFLVNDKKAIANVPDSWSVSPDSQDKALHTICDNGAYKTSIVMSLVEATPPPAKKISTK